MNERAKSREYSRGPAWSFELWPRFGYWGRMRLYCRAMFPWSVRLTNAVLLYFAYSILVCRVNDWTVTLWSTWTALGIFNLVGLAFILRLMDELKDLEIDRQLFADRPVPAGAVLESDIRFTLVGTTAAYIAVNALSPHTLWLAMICVGYTYLMMIYFFNPRLLRRNLLANLATHNPSIPLFLLLTTAVVSAQQTESLASVVWGDTLLAIVMFWSLLLAWELSRKIRSREEENAYVTYSQIFGRIQAALITLAVQTVTLSLGLYFAITFRFAAVMIVLLLAGYSLACFADCRFIVRPSSRTSRLRPFAEVYTATVFLALIADFVVCELGG